MSPERSMASSATAPSSSRGAQDDATGHALGQQLALVPPHVVILVGHTHQRNQKVGQALAASPGGREATALPGLDAALGMPGRRGDPMADAVSMLGWQPWHLHCTLLEAGDEAEEGEEEWHSEGEEGAGRALAAALRGEVDQLERPLAQEDVFLETSLVLGGG